VNVAFCVAVMIVLLGVTTVVVFASPTTITAPARMATAATHRGIIIFMFMTAALSYIQQLSCRDYNRIIFASQHLYRQVWAGEILPPLPEVNLILVIVYPL